MKKFEYSLETVLRYKRQILDHLQEEYAKCLADVRSKEEEIAELLRQRREAEIELAGKESRGSRIEDLMVLVQILERMTKTEERLRKELQHLQNLAEAKKKEVVDANIDVKKFEKMKEKKKEEYAKLEAKENEKFIEEFVSNSTSSKLREEPPA